MREFCQNAVSASWVSCQPVIWHASGSYPDRNWLCMATSVCQPRQECYISQPYRNIRFSAKEEPHLHEAAAGDRLVHRQEARDAGSGVLHTTSFYGSCREHTLRLWGYSTACRRGACSAYYLACMGVENRTRFRNSLRICKGDEKRTSPCIVLVSNFTERPHTVLLLTCGCSARLTLVAARPDGKAGASSRQYARGGGGART